MSSLPEAGLSGTPETITDLVAAAQGGSHRAFAELIERHQVLLTSLALTLTGDLAASEEIAQEAFVRAWQRLPTLRRPTFFRSWLCSIVRNIHYNSHRRERPWRTASAPGDEVASVEPSPLDRAISIEEQIQMRAALAELPEAYRVVLVLYYREQQSIDKVAEALGVSVNTVRNRLSRSRKVLAERVSSLGSALFRSRPTQKLGAATMAAIAALPRSSQAEVDIVGKAAARRAGFSKLAAVLLVPALLAGGTWFVNVYVVPDTRSPIAEIPVLGTTVRSGFAPWKGDPLGERDQALADERSKMGETIFGFDFEDGVLPPVFTTGYLVSGPTRWGNRHSLMGTLTPSYWGSYTVTMGDIAPRSALFTASSSMVVTFDYWLEAGDYGIAVTVFNENEARNYSIYGSHGSGSTVHEKWAHAEVRLRDFVAGLFTDLPGGPPIEDGDSIRNLYFRGGEVGGPPFYLDNVRIADYGGNIDSVSSSFNANAR